MRADGFERRQRIVVGPAHRIQHDRGDTHGPVPRRALPLASGRTRRGLQVLGRHVGPRDVHGGRARRLEHPQRAARAGHLHVSDPDDHLPGFRVDAGRARVVPDGFLPGRRRRRKRRTHSPVVAPAPGTSGRRGRRRVVVHTRMTTGQSSRVRGRPSDIRLPRARRTVRRGFRRVRDTPAERPPLARLTLRGVETCASPPSPCFLP